MEKKVETSKPGLNRSRRQLLLGAGLTPVVMTLHSAKVYADVTLQKGVSGPAPYSGVIKGSANLNNVMGDEASECKLYNLLANDTTPEVTALRTYYGEPGYGTVSSLEGLLSTNAGWTYGALGTMGGPANWVSSYEGVFITKIQTYANAVNTINVAVKKGDITEANPRIDDPVATLSPDLTLPAGADSVGIFEFTSDAKTLLESEYATAKTAYNALIAAANGSKEAGDEGYLEPWT